tara:strand:+ start:133 stop:1197 length:1065 start_codon:yes stop_codon:yes gene_type:complete
MSEIDLPQAPGFFISRWREKGPVDIETLTQWRDELNWKTWLPLAEAAMYLDAAELLEILETVLTPAETATLALVRRRMLGDTRLQQSIEEALDIARHPDTRDLALEGRLRMELGLAKYELGDVEGAKEDLTWAETRLKSVALASRDHDLSLINKAALHTACGEPVMALAVYSDIPRDGNHADETIALSRLGASRICASMGHEFDAARHAWNAHGHAIKARQIGMAIEGGALFLDFSSLHVDESAERMHIQVEQSRPRQAGEEARALKVHPDDIDSVFEWCCANLPDDNSGQDRPDLRAMVSLASRFDKLELFKGIIENPDSIEDSMLAAIVQNMVTEQHLKGLWDIRLATLTKL